jgi:sialic acid synthase SpsE
MFPVPLKVHTGNQIGNKLKTYIPKIEIKGMLPEETYVIAEAGINHNGDFDTAKQLVQEAATVGANAVKFQIWDAPKLSSDSDFIKDLTSWELKRDEWNELNNIANRRGVDFLASVFDQQSVDILTDFNPKFIKIASGDLTHTPLIDYIAAQDIPIILSTGMATMEEVSRAVRTIREHHDNLVLLHCISSYPVGIEQLNLRSIDVLRDAFYLPVGYSDHTLGTLAPSVAVSRGARVVEKHFTLDKTMEGPDQELSAEPDEFAAMVEQIRQIEKSKGEREIATQPVEEDSKTAMRRSLTARSTIKKGETISEDKVKIARPEQGIPPNQLTTVLGRLAGRDIETNESIRWSDVR